MSDTRPMRHILPIIPIILLFFLAEVLTLPHYGMNEDSPIHFLRGQAYLQKLSSGQDKFDIPKLPSPALMAPGQHISLYKLNAAEDLHQPLRPIGIVPDNFPSMQEAFYKAQVKTKKHDSFYKHNAWNATFWDNFADQGHPAISDTFMALTNRIFYETLRILGDIESYYLYIVFASTLSLIFVYLFTKKAFGQISAFFATAVLATYPYFFAESHFNIKDPVQMSFFTVTVVSFYFWVTGGLKKRWFAFFVLGIFLALGTKINIIFLPAIVLPWLIFLYKKPSIREFLTAKRLIIYGGLAAVIPLVLILIFWPYLWTETFRKLAFSLNFYQALSQVDTRIQTPISFPLPLGFDAKAILRILSTTPIITLVLFIAGLLAIATRRIKTTNREILLLLLWLLIPILRASRQSAEIVGSIRNFIEFLPALAIIAGIGASFLITKLSKIQVFQTSFRLKTLNIICILVIGFWLLLPIWQSHPNENTYFNFLAGGINGAQDLKLYDWDTSYNNVYRQGINWLNKNAPKNAKLAYLDGSMMAISPIWLRPDIYFGSYFSAFEQKGEYIISLVYPSPPSVFAYHYLERFLNPVYELKIDNVTLLKIWKNDPAFVKKDLSKQVELKGNFITNRFQKDKTDIWEADFGQKATLTQMILSAPKDCKNTEGIWSIVLGNKEDFLVPQTINLEKGFLEIDFPGSPANKIRFRGEKESCIYQSEIEILYTIQ